MAEEEEEEEAQVVALRVPRSLVKTVKTALEAQGVFGRQISRVAACSAEEGSAEEMFSITTTIPAGSGSDNDADADQLLASLHLPSHSLTTTAPTTPRCKHTNPLTTALHSLLTTLPLPPSTLAALLATAPTHYTHHPPLLLLPTGTFSHTLWQSLLPTLPPTFFATLASALGCTHLAINAPIPPSSTTRSPLALTPLHGAFTDPPLWVRAVQNGIVQVWPPAHCMFSRGNVKEKARVLRFPRVEGEQVVDLYAGIGYFAFSYAAAGAARVWCWEVSSWSVEALRRGAGENGWVVEVVEEGGEVVGGVRGLDEGGVGIVVFRESNECAVGRLRALGVRGVRHVNMGYLPDCRAVWPAAAEILGDGGVAHVHGNVAVGAEGEYSQEVVESFGGLLGERGRGRVSCEHVEVVKTYAPGVVHCVFDIKIEDQQ